jgi:hypothetical protein
MKRLIATAFVVLCLGSIPASAHHSLAAYIMSTYRTVDGTVKTFQWVNPHARLVLVVPNANGASTQWEFEGGSIGRLVSGGFTKDGIKSGDKVTVAYSPKRDKGIGGFFLAVTTADGTTYATDRFKQIKGGGVVDQ